MDSGFRWIGAHPIMIDELINGKYDKKTASERAYKFSMTKLTDIVISALVKQTRHTVYAGANKATVYKFCFGILS